MMQERSCVGVVALSAELEQHCSCTEFISKAILQHTSGEGLGQTATSSKLFWQESWLAAFWELLHRSAAENNIVKIRNLCKLWNWFDPWICVIVQYVYYVIHSSPAYLCALVHCLLCDCVFVFDCLLHNKVFPCDCLIVFYAIRYSHVWLCTIVRSCAT